MICQNETCWSTWNKLVCSEGTSTELEKYVKYTAWSSIYLPRWVTVPTWIVSLIGMELLLWYMYSHTQVLVGLGLYLGSEFYPQPVTTRLRGPSSNPSSVLAVLCSFGNVTSSFCFILVFKTGIIQPTYCPGALCGLISVCAVLWICKALGTLLSMRGTCKTYLSASYYIHFPRSHLMYNHWQNHYRWMLTPPDALRPN